MSQTVKFRICGWGVLLGSIALLILTGVTNWFQGGHQGVTLAGKIINSVGSVSIDVMGLLFCGLAAGVCFGTRRWGWAIVFSIALVASAGWSANSVYSFQATEAISASKTRATANERILEADKIAKDSVGKLTAYAGKAKSTAAREDFIYGQQEAIKSFRDAEVKVIVAPDAGAEIIASKLGVSLETVQQIRSAYFAILIIFLKMIGFPGAGFLLSWSPPEPPSAKLAGSTEPSGSKDKKQDATVADTPANVVDFPAKVSAPTQPLQAAPQQLQAPPPKVSSGPPRVPAPAPTTSVQTSNRSILEILANHPSPLSQRALAHMAGKTEATVSRELQRLEGRGKVKRERKGRSVKVTGVQRHGGLYAIGH